MQRLMTRRAALTTAVAAFPLAAVPIRPTQAAPGPLRQPQGKVILTIAGQSTNTNLNGTAVFDIAMLEELGVKGFSTTTPWYNGPVSFEGVPMAQLLDHVGATGTKVTALALNDYSTDIPLDDFRHYDAILAFKRDGAYMPVRDKGPLFIVYPYDSNPALKHQRYYSRSAWQVARLVVT